MKRSLLFLVLLFTLYSQNSTAQSVTGLDGWTIFLDPGHSQTENMGLYNYSEPQKVLRVGLALREMLLTQTDIDTVYMSRTNDNQLVGLSQRSDRANSLGVDFYYSLHSDAGGSSANSALMLHGGWRSNGQTVEKNPPGGKLMGDLANVNLPSAMRIPTRGNFADRTFYQGFPTNHGNQYPYLSVNRRTNMASLLTESGFHTNPTQQQRNLNAEWKRLEAQSHFWSILQYHEAERPDVGIVTGYITSTDDGKTLNGISVSIEGQTYVTDTYESLFKNYSSPSEELSNGFYYIENLPNGPNQIIFEAEGYYSDTVDVDILEDNFTFTDVGLTSNVPPFIASVSLEEGKELNRGEGLTLNFSRGMNRESVENALSISPDANISFDWASDSELRIVTNSLIFESEYTVTIDSTAFDNSSYQHGLDGNGDGTSGGAYSLTFETGPEDIFPPEISDIFPTNTSFSELTPILSASFNEQLDASLIDSTSFELSLTGVDVPGTIAYYSIGDKSVLNFFPSQRLRKNSNYVIHISGSLQDTLGNQVGSDIFRSFPTGNQEAKEQIIVDDFDAGLSAWWAPSQSGSSSGYVGEETGFETDASKVNLLFGSSQSMKVDYGWKTEDSNHLLRIYRGGVSTPTFSNSHILQVYIFGDGNGNQFRFMLRDGNGQLEGSEWYTIDWLGWKLVTWDLSEDEIVGWVNGDGTLDGSLYLDSFQLSYTPGQPSTGFINFDDLRAVKMGLATSNEEEWTDTEIPTQIHLDQNYPNPFNPTTNIRFALPERSNVNIAVYDLLGKKVASIYSGVKAAGSHTVQFDASNLASGIYLYRLETSAAVISKKMILLK